MKKVVKILLYVILVLILVMSITGCSNDKNDNIDNSSNNGSNENVNEELLGTWSGESNGKSTDGAKQAKVESTWLFDEDKVILTNYYDYLSEGKISWNGTYKIEDDSTIIIKLDNWDYERKFSYKIKDGKYLDLINITDELEGVGFPSYENLVKE